MKRLFINRWIILILQMPLSASCFGINSFADSTRTDTTIFLHNEIIVSALQLEDSTFSLPQAISAINNSQIAQYAPTSLPKALAWGGNLRHSAKERWQKLLIAAWLGHGRAQGILCAGRAAI